MISRWARGERVRGASHVDRDEEVIVREFKVIATSEDRWLAGGDVVGSHLKSWLGGWLRVGLDIFLHDFIVKGQWRCWRGRFRLQLGAVIGRAEICGSPSVSPG